MWAGLQGLVPAVWVATATRERQGPCLESRDTGLPGPPQAKDSRGGLAWAGLVVSCDWIPAAPPLLLGQGV